MISFFARRKEWNVSDLLSELPDRKSGVVISTRVIQDIFSFPKSVSQLQAKFIFEEVYGIKPEELSRIRRVQKDAQHMLPIRYNLFNNILDFGDCSVIEMTANLPGGEEVGRVSIVPERIKLGRKSLSTCHVFGFEIDPEWQGTSVVPKILKEVIYQSKQFDVIRADIELDHRISESKIKNLIKLYSRLGFEAYIIKDLNQSSLRIFKAKNEKLRNAYIEYIGINKDKYLTQPLSEVDISELRSKIEAKEKKAPFQNLKMIVSEFGGRGMRSIVSEANLIAESFRDFDNPSKPYERGLNPEEDRQLDNLLLRGIEKLISRSDELPGESNKANRPILAITHHSQLGGAFPHLCKAAEENSELLMPCLVGKQFNGDLSEGFNVIVEFESVRNFKPVYRKLGEDERISIFGIENGEGQSVNSLEGERIARDKSETLKSLSHLKSLLFSQPSSLILDDITADTKAEVLEWLDGLDNNNEVVVKANSLGLGTGVYISSKEYVDEIVAYINKIRADHLDPIVILQEKIVPIPIEDPDYENVDWNIRLLSSKAEGFIDAEIRLGESGGPINKSQGAKVVSFDSLISEYGYSQEFLDELRMKLKVVGELICKHLDLGFAGLDIILRKTKDSYEICVIEVNGSASGGVTTLFDLRRGKDRNAAAERLLSAITRLASEDTNRSSSNGVTEITSNYLLDSSFESISSVDPEIIKLLSKGLLKYSEGLRIDELIEEYCGLFIHNYSLIKAENDLELYVKKSTYGLLKEFMRNVVPFLDQAGVSEKVQSLFLSLFYFPEELSDLEMAYMFVHQLMEQNYQTAKWMLPIVRTRENAFRYAQELCSLHSRNFEHLLPALAVFSGEAKLTRGMKKILTKKEEAFSKIGNLWSTYLFS